MCLNCGCGELSNNHGDPYNITLSRLRIIAMRNHSTMSAQAANILATLRGEITKVNPLDHDKIEVDLTRIKQEPEKKAEYVERTRTKLKTKSKRSVG